LVEPRMDGTPQGGPLSPLLSNILLNDWIRSWNDGSSRSAATPMTATSMWAVAWREIG
jgi:retron-type reverse transcriptase